MAGQALEKAPRLGSSASPWARRVASTASLASARGEGGGEPAELLGISHATDRVARVALLMERVSSQLADLTQPDPAAPARVPGGLSAPEIAAVRELALSLATWDRMLFNFIVERLQHAGVRPPPAGSSVLQAVAALQGLPSTLQTKLIPPGGMNSLLYHFSSTLEDVRTAVQGLGGTSSSTWTLASRWLYPLATLALIVAIHRARVQVPGMPWHFRSTASIGLLSILLYTRLSSHSDAAERVSLATRQLSLLTRLWVITLDQFSTTNATLSSSKSYALNIADLREGAHLDPTTANAVPVRRMLINTSLPSDAAIWCTKNWRLFLLKRALDIVYASVSEGFRLRGTAWSALAIPATLVAAGWYAVRPSEAAEVATTTLQHCHVDFVKEVWNAVDAPLLRSLTAVVADEPPAEGEVHLPHPGGSLHVFCSVPVPEEWWVAPPPQHLVPPLLTAEGADIPAAAVKPHEVHCTRAAGRAGSHARLPALTETTALLHGGEVEQYTLHQATVPPQAVPPPQPPPHTPLPPSTASSTVLLYVHGGGFVAGSFAVDRLRCAKWAAGGHFSVAYMHYTLAPEARFPTALNQCMTAYAWCRARFGKVVLFGDSAGGNYVAAITTRCVAEGLPLPDALLLAYPSLNVNHAPGPSRALHLNDPLIPRGLMTTVSDAYVPQHMLGRPHANPYLSPCLASDAVLSAFPPTFVVNGGLDPLLDDSIDFITRLRRLGVPGSMKVYRSLPHGFFSFDFLPLADQAVLDVQRWCCEA